MTRDRAALMAERAFERLDVNQDGTIDPADRAARQRTRFDRLDADGNGAISFAEFEAAHPDRSEAQAGEGRRGGGQIAGHMGGGMGGRGMHRSGDMVRAADADGDGAITRDEFRSAALARFAAADTDADGTLSRDERRAQRQEMHGEGREPAPERPGPAG